MGSLLLFKLFIPSGINFGRRYALENSSILGYLVFQIINSIVISNNILKFIQVSRNCTLLISNLINLCLLPLCQLAKGLSVLLTFSKKQYFLWLTLCSFLLFSLFSSHYFLASTVRRAICLFLEGLVVHCWVIYLVFLKSL